MNLNRLRFRSGFRDVCKVLAINLVMIILILCGLFGALMGDLSTNWTNLMKQTPVAVMPEYRIGEQFEHDGITYEYIPLPEGVDRDTVRAKIDLRHFDGIRHGEITYLLYEDPFGTGEDVVFFYPFLIVGGSKQPLAFYAKVVSEG